MGKKNKKNKSSDDVKSEIVTRYSERGILFNVINPSFSFIISFSKTRDLQPGAPEVESFSMFLIHNVISEIYNQMLQKWYLFSMFHSLFNCHRFGTR